MKNLLSIMLMLILSCSLQAEDKLEMEGISIVGNSELPKSLYIVPWKQPEKRSSAGKPVNTLIDAILLPVERESFRRRLQYHSSE